MTDTHLGNHESPLSQGSSSSDPVYALAAPPLSSLVFAGRASGLYRSMDNGVSWQPALVSTGRSGPAPAAAVAVSPSFDHDRTAIAGVPGGAIRSTNGGATWQELRFQPPAPFFTALAFSPGFLEDGVILGSSVEDGFLRTDNGGDTWSTWNFGLLDLEVLCMAVSPAFPRDETLYAGTSSGLFRSTNGGRAWKEVQLPCGHVPVLSLAMDSTGQNLYAGTETQGLFTSIDRGKSWLPDDLGLLEGAIDSILVCAGGSPCLATLVGGSVYVSTGRQAGWRALQFPGGGRVASAIFAPLSFGLDLPLYIGFGSGEVIHLDRLAPSLK